MPLIEKPYLCFKLSDTFPSPAAHTAPGFKDPGEYKWSEQDQMHILDGKLYDPADPAERAQANKDADNHFRAHHRYHYPVPVLVTRLVESGFDEPEPVSLVVPAGEPIPEGVTEVIPVPPAPVLEPEPERGDTPPPATPVARKKAHTLGVDLETLRGRGTGAGGLITVDDVVAQWNLDGGNAAPVVSGPVRMADVLAASAETP